MSQSGAQRHHSRPAVLLGVLCMATFMSGLDVFIVNVGLHPIGQALGKGSLADLSWILNAYAIVFAALLVPAGRLGDRYGVKPAFLIGLALFTAGSLGCALSGGLWLLVGLRCLQAVGAAALVPTSLGLVLTAIPEERRRRAIQLWAISGSLGAAAGPALGGLLVQVSWRWIFVVNVPIGIAALVVAALVAPDSRHSTETGTPDLLGGALLVMGIGALTLAMVEGPTWGWGSGRTLIAFAVAVAAAPLFLARSARAAAPVVDLALFRHRAFAWGNLANLALGICFGIQLLGLVLWLQEGWGWSAVRTGLAIAPGPVMVSVTAIGLRRYHDRLPDAIKTIIGSLLMGGGGLLIGTSLTVHPHYATQILPGWLVEGVGVGLAIPTIIRAASAGLAPQQTSTGSAVVQMGRQLGNVVGVAILVIVVGSSTVTAGDLDRFSRSWWWAAAFALVAALACLPLLGRDRGAPLTPEPVAVTRGARTTA
ncbi:MFS transporter [Actinacidiphila acididurans]|uniref:MFS transporter n=1 Tax=Actinacidiphila acididurans TaxID=2784346 RepID=A0ABS2U1J9_9ACTN|nr:MFS transporter [Actinacidiphila acididurans]MBM9509477.1 MFS transporter [Actinacidiphila acididurans]